MRMIKVILLLVAGFATTSAQTVLIDPNGSGGFEGGNTFAANGWTVVNDNVNAWAIGNAVGFGGFGVAYISNDGGLSNIYSRGVFSVSHFFRDVTFPAGETMILLSLAHRSESFDADEMDINIVSTETTPVASQVVTGAEFSKIGFSGAAGSSGLFPKEYRFNLPASFAGTTKRIVFTWRNNISSGTGRPSAVDKISLTSEGGTISNGTGGGPWSSRSTWAGGNVPAASDNVVIRDGDQVTINLDIDVKNLAVGEGVSGLLEFDAVIDRTLLVQGHVVVGEGATFTAGAAGTGSHALVLGGDLNNNGTLDFSTNAGQGVVNIEFNGSTDQSFLGFGPVTDITSVTVSSATTTATILISPTNLTIQGTNTGAPGFLISQRGIVRLSGEAPLESVVFTSTSLSVATGTAIWLDNPNLVVNPQADGMNVSGTLRVSAGVLNVGEDQDDCIILAPGSTFITEGGAVNVSAAIGVVSPSHSVKFLQTGGVITVQRFGNSSTTFAGFDLGTSSLTNATTTAGTITIEQANTALTGPGDFRVPFVFNVTGGELHLGNATTTAQTTFRIRGVIPNLVVDPTRNHTVQLFQTSSFAFSTIIPPGITLDLNANTLSLRGDLDITAGATLMSNATGSALSLGGSSPQVVKLDGYLVDGFVRSVVVSNSSGATPAVSFNNDFAVSNTLFLTNGSLGGPGIPTLGNSVFSSTFTLTRVNGSLLTQPLFGPGVTFNANYNNSLVQTVTGPELPSTVGTLTINDPAGVYLNATTTATTLSLSNGALNTDDSRVIIVSGTSPSNIISSGTGFVSGPVVITLPANLDGSVDYPVPVGTTVKRPVTLVAAKTDPTPNTRVFFRAHDYFGGVAGDGISALPDGLRWFVTALTGQGGNVTETRVRFSEGGYGGGNEVAKSETIDGTYNSVGGTVLGTSITSDVFNSFSYFAVGLTDNTKSGVYTVGSAGDYGTITDAVADFDTSAFSGPVTLSLLDASYPSETFPIIVRQIAGVSASNTLTIKPAAGISPVISGDTFDFAGLIKLEGADFVTIDGSNNGTNSRDMTITCTGTYNPMIWLSSQGAGLGARHNTFKNLNLSGGLSQVSTNTGPHAIIASGTTPISDGADNDSNKVHNNLITKVRYGVVFRGVSGNPNEGNSVTNNYIGSAAFGADQIGKVGIGAMHQSGITISGNTIRSLGSIYPNVPDGAGDDRVGIALGADSWPPISSSAISNAVVTGNVIQDVVEESVESAVGILVAATGISTNNLIANNMISGVRANGTSGNYAAGIGFHSGQGDKIVFNSVQMVGDVDPSTSTSATGSNIGINVRGGSNLTVKNNIIFADLTSNTGTLEHYAITVPSSYSWGTGGIDYNDYHINTSNAQMKLGGIGSVVPYTPYADLTEWKTNFSATQDANSKSFAPDFTSTADLHLNVGSTNTDYVGTPISGVTTDYDGETRNASFPYIGADEVPDYSLPVLMAEFTAEGRARGAELRWKTETEVDNYGFEIERKMMEEGRWKMENGAEDMPINHSTDHQLTSWSEVGFVKGSGTSSSPKEYSFVDRSLPSGRYAYRIKQIDNNGLTRYTGAIEVEVGLAPREFTLSQNYPNPFNPTTTIEFTLPEDGNVRLRIYNMLGEEVVTLLDEERKAGVYQQVVFDASRLATGLYFSQLEFGGRHLIKKMLLVK